MRLFKYILLLIVVYWYTFFLFKYRDRRPFLDWEDWCLFWWNWLGCRGVEHLTPGKREQMLRLKFNRLQKNWPKIKLSWGKLCASASHTVISHTLIVKTSSPFYSPTLLFYFYRLSNCLLLLLLPGRIVVFLILVFCSYILGEPGVSVSTIAHCHSKTFIYFLLKF